MATIRASAPTATSPSPRTRCNSAPMSKPMPQPRALPFTAISASTCSSSCRRSRSSSTSRRASTSRFEGHSLVRPARRRTVRRPAPLAFARRRVHRLSVLLGQRFGRSHLGQTARRRCFRKSPCCPTSSGARGSTQLECASCPATPRRRSHCRRPSRTTRRCACIPWARSACSENVVPLDLAITRYGNATPSDGRNLSLSATFRSTRMKKPRQPIQDYFAAGQFLTLSDADKISAAELRKIRRRRADRLERHRGRPGFVRAPWFTRNTTFHDPNAFSRLLALLCDAREHPYGDDAQGAGFASPAKNTGLAKYAVSVDRLADPVQEAATYVITSVEIFASAATSSRRRAALSIKAQAALDSYLAIHPEDAQNLQIMALHEVAA